MQNNSEEKRTIPEAAPEEELDATAIMDDEDFSAKDVQTKSKLSSDIFDFLEMLAIAACAILLLFSFVFRLSAVEGTSMVRALDDGDKLIVSGLFYEPKQGDIVVFQDLDNERYQSAIVKRVIAVGGQTVTIRYTQDGMTVLVDGVVLDESDYRTFDHRYFNPKTHVGEKDYPVPEGSIFVLGDNTYVSEDSRGSFGCVDADKVIGRVVFRLCGDDFASLFTKFGTVK